MAERGFSLLIVIIVILFAESLAFASILPNQWTTSLMSSPPSNTVVNWWDYFGYFAGVIVWALTKPITLMLSIITLLFFSPILILSVINGILLIFALVIFIYWIWG